MAIETSPAHHDPPIRPVWLLAVLGAVLACAVAPSRASGAPSLDIRDAIGAYRFADGSVGAVFEQDAVFRYVNYRSGALRNIRRAGPRLFVGGPGVAVADPVSLRIAFGPLNGIKRVTWIVVNGQRGDRIVLASRPASFVDAGITLVGRLLAPAGKKRRPAVVIVPAARGTNDMWALFYASQGYAVLTYARRGVGHSGGVYDHSATQANMTTLAADALAGVAWLSKQPEADRSRIGLAGGSQAGWVIPLAASESSTVRFAAMQSSPAMSAGRQAAYANLTGFGRRSPSDQQIHDALASVPDSDFDPRPAISALTIPVLWQLGAVDRRMYTDESVADIAAITAQGTHDFTVHVYPGGAHSLRLTDTGVNTEELTSPGYVPGLFNDLGAWLRAHSLGRQ